MADGTTRLEPASAPGDPDAAGGAPGALPDSGGGRLDGRVPGHALLLVVVLAVVGPFVPGVISYDANAMLYEGLPHATVRDWYSPAGAGLLQLTHHLGLGLDVLFIAQSALAVAGVYLCLRVLLKRVPAALFTGAVCVFPPMYDQVGELSRDTFYLGLTLLALGLLSRAQELGAGGARRAVAGLALLAAILSFLARQNGIATLVLIALALAWLVLRDPLWRPSRMAGARWTERPVLAGGGALVLAAVLCLVVVGASRVAYSAGNVLSTHPERALQVYDLASMSTKTGTDLFPPHTKRLVPMRLGVTPPDIRLSALEANFHVNDVLSVYAPDGDWTRGLNDPNVIEPEAKALRTAWLKAIEHHPGDYATTRLALLASQLGVGHEPDPVSVGLAEPTNFGHTIAFQSGFNAADDYIGFFVGSDSTIALDWIWTYLLVLTLAAWFLRRRLRAAALPLTLLARTMWLTILVFAFTAPASSLRYVILAVPGALILGVLAIVVACAGQPWARALLLARPAPQPTPDR
jgi:hypothetical protein